MCLSGTGGAFYTMKWAPRTVKRTLQATGCFRIFGASAKLRPPPPMGHNGPSCSRLSRRKESLCNSRKHSGKHFSRC
jgi:hypothetical protein